MGSARVPSTDPPPVDRQAPLRIALLYASVGLLWVLFSDHLLRLFFIDPAVLSGLQTVKGLLFVGLTTGVLYLLLERHAQRIRRSDRALRQSERNHRLLMEQASDAIFLADARANYIDLNAAACRMLGYNRDELLSMNAADLVPEEDLPVIADRVDRLAAGETLLWEQRLRRKDGSLVTCEINAKRLPDGRFQAIARDITARKRLEERLRQSQKMEALGRLAGGIAHDFNNLLMTIRGYTDLVLAATPESDPRRTDLLDIVAAAERASALVRRLLTFSRRREARLEVVRLDRVVQDLARLLERTLGDDVRLAVSLEEALPIKADPSQIEQVLMNLTVNARDAMPEGGTLSIEVRNVTIESAEPPEAGGLPPGPYVRLTVADTGYGMEDETKARAFEPFFTTKEDGHGTGLGLATVYGIAEEHGARIRLESAPGAGTVFHIDWPTREVSDALDDPAPTNYEREPSHVEDRAAGG